jgi:hypothetical protein
MEPTKGIRELLGMAVTLAQARHRLAGEVTAASAEVYAHGAEELWLTVATAKGDLRVRLSPPHWDRSDWVVPDVGVFNHADPVDLEWDESDALRAKIDAAGVRSRPSPLAD